MDDTMQVAPQVPSDNQATDQVSPPVPDPQANDTAPVEAVEPEISANTPPVAPAGSDFDDSRTDSQRYDEEIKSNKIETQRKTFFLDLKANNIGRYVKISERSSGKRSTIIIPEENVQEFINKIHGLFS